MKKFIKPLLFSISTYIVLTFLISIFNYIGLLNGTFLTIFKIFIPIITFFINGILIGNNSTEKGWLNGIISASILIFLIIILDLIFKIKFNIKIPIFYLIYVFICIFGSILGINKKNK